MFEISNRKRITDLIAPAGDYVFEEGIITTYSLDPDMILVVLMALNDLNINTDDKLKNYQKLVETISEKKLTVVCNKGCINPFKNSYDIKNLLDSIIIEKNVSLFNFHPKIWVLKYSNGKDSVFKLMCTSKNLTYSEMFEVMFIAEGRISHRRRQNKNDNLRKFLQYATRDRKRHNKLIEDLKMVKFDNPTVEFNFYSKFNGDNSMLEFKKEIGSAGRAIIISPFINERFIRKMLPGVDSFEHIDLISDKMELDGILKVKERFRNVYNFIESSAEKGEKKDNNETAEEIEQSVKANDYDVKAALHAKVYILQKDKNCVIWLGSANATSNGWEDGANVEAMVRIALNNYSVEKFEDEFIYKDGKKKESNDRDNREKETKKKRELFGYLEGYEYDEKRAKKTKNKKKNEKKLDEVMKAVKFHIKYNRSKKITTVTLVNSEKFKDISKKSSAEVIVTLFDSRKVNIKEFINKKNIQFKEFELKDISSFIEVTVVIGRCMSTRLILAQFEGNPITDRQNAVLKNIIKDEKDFYRYVDIIFLGNRVNAIDVKQEADLLHDRTNKGRNWKKSIICNPCLENILKYYTREKVEAIDNALRFKHLRNRVEKFYKFWQGFKSAIKYYEK